MVPTTLGLTKAPHPCGTFIPSFEAHGHFSQRLTAAFWASFNHTRTTVTGVPSAPSVTWTSLLAVTGGGTSPGTSSRASPVPTKPSFSRAATTSTGRWGRSPWAAGWAELNQSVAAAHLCLCVPQKTEAVPRLPWLRSKRAPVASIFRPLSLENLRSLRTPCGESLTPESCCCFRCCIDSIEYFRSSLAGASLLWRSSG